MANCPRCGADVPEGRVSCASCGAPLPFPVQPPYGRDPEPKPHKRSRYAVMSIGAYIGTFILFNIPVVNFIIALVWACGGTYSQNKRNYARAMLIFWGISAVLAVLAAFLGVNWLQLFTSVIQSV